MKNKHQKLIEMIKQNSVLKIAGGVHQVKSKTHYANVSNPDLTYSKFILDSGKILVVNADRKSIFLGEIVDDFANGETFPDKFSFNGKTFQAFEKDYQVVTSIEFGNPRECEGECVWVDYTCVEDETICVDMAYVYRDKKRADIYAQWIGIEDVEIVK